MKANKVTVEIVVECLHVDSVRGLLVDLVGLLSNENIAGQLVKEDGDTVSWSTNTKPVEF